MLKVTDKFKRTRRFYKLLRIPDVKHDRRKRHTLCKAINHDCRSIHHAKRFKIHRTLIDINQYNNLKKNEKHVKALRQTMTKLMKIDDNGQLR